MSFFKILRFSVVASPFFSIGGHRPGKPSFSSEPSSFYFNTSTPVSCGVIDTGLSISILSEILTEKDKSLLTLVLGLEDVNDFNFVEESELSDLIRSGYHNLTIEQRGPVSEASALFKIRKVFYKFVKPKLQKIPETEPVNHSNGNGSVWSAVAITRNSKSTERDSSKFPSIVGGRWDGFKDVSQRPVKVFVREIGQVGSEQSMTSIEIYRYLCSQISPTIKRELSEYLN